jgi:exonuclease SbcC
MNIKKDLYQIIGKDEFRNYVLAYIEAELVMATNEILKSIYGGRYQLEQEFKHLSQSDFQVKDNYHAQSIRKVATLSGGETFIISIAMARALSEMSKGSIDIDAFFIDEGFGSLDEASLSEILEMLYSIEGFGKQIGIISHVKSLTDRIPSQLMVIKGAQGFSEIHY